MYFNLVGQHAVVLDEAELALALLDCGGGVYSHRPFLFMRCDLVGCKDSLPLSPYNDRAKSIRTKLTRAIGTKKLLEPLVPMQEAETHEGCSKNASVLCTVTKEI